MRFTLLGLTAQQAQRSAQVFKEYDEASLIKLFKLYGNQKEYINQAKQNLKNLENAMRADQDLNNPKNEQEAT